jgi:Ni/Fe-hydrogenase 1 B-type cytochrome subunit
MSAAAVPAASAARPVRDADLVRVYVWQVPVRLTHWLIALSIAVLSVTGIYMGRPFLIVPGEARFHFVMGTMKVVHFYAAIVFTLSVLARVAWMFLGNWYARWPSFIPWTRRRRQGLIGTFEFYIFALRKPPGFIAHNPLAGLAYSAVFFLYFVMIGTGLALYAADAGVTSPFRVFGFLAPLFGGLQSSRWIHHVVMWLLLGFTVHHVYSGLLMSQVEQNATIESIFSGYKFIDRKTLRESDADHLSDHQRHG